MFIILILLIIGIYFLAFHYIDEYLTKLSTIRRIKEKETQAIYIRYTNYAGVVSIRKITPIEIKFGSNKWHLEPQWLMIAYDFDKQDYRTFAIKDIHEFDIKIEN